MGTLEEELKTRARTVENRMLEDNLDIEVSKIDTLCKKLAQVMKCRITIVLPSGEVIGESDENPLEMENHLKRPEIQKALNGALGKSIRYSNTLSKSMMYIAIPLSDHNRNVSAVIRTSISTSAIEYTLGIVYFNIVIVGVVVALIAALICLFVSHRISQPLHKMKQVADRFARGDFSMRLNVSNSEEISHLAKAMNYMAEQLDARIKTINHQRKQQEAIFASMVEGVIAVDKDNRLISLNYAAAQLLDVKSDDITNKRIDEVIANPELYQVIKQALLNHEIIEGEIVITNQERRFLKAHGAAMQDSNGAQIGSVIVLHDVTTVRRLENLRRDFVANVSHELKTPITSIKGFVETLMEGALDDRDDAMRFLGIIARQTDRLNAIIEDLLSLSRVEQGKEQDSIPKEHSSINNLIQSAIECCKNNSQEKNINIIIVNQEDIIANINPPLLEQAVVNLIDNAVKYSESGSQIQIEVTCKNDLISINVQDWGCGIMEEHLPRIFERFYRVDKARSRKLGGTGLGLAIVKHITQTHGGYVTVTSEYGSGSTFSIHLPAAI